MNAEKTVYMPFCCNEAGLPNFTELKINHNNQVFIIKEAETVKYLGVYIDPHLKWNIQTENLNKKN